MRSTVEPLPREEDTAQVRCRDTGSEGGGYGARLSDMPYMNSTELVGNMLVDMSAMHIRVGKCPGKKQKWPRSRGERSHKGAGQNPARRERSSAQGRREAPL